MQRATLIPHCGWEFNCTQVRKFWVNVPLASPIQPLRTDVLWSGEDSNMFSHAVHIGMALRYPEGRRYKEASRGGSPAACGHFPWSLCFARCPSPPHPRTLTPGTCPCSRAYILLPYIRYQKVCHGAPIFKGLRTLKGSELKKKPKTNSVNAFLEPILEYALSV